jgi:glutathionylspermidine synthase
MIRKRITPRNNWQTLVEQQGFLYHTLADVPYWDESVCYGFAQNQIDHIEGATNELQNLYIQATDYVIKNNLFHHFAIPAFIIPEIIRTWEASENNHWSLYGRFDLIMQDGSIPKLLEYNADTPTSLFESAVVQWFWLQDYNSNLKQFNEIDEALEASWKFIHSKYQSQLYTFACLKDATPTFTAEELNEDIVNTGYILDTAARSQNFNYQFIDISEIQFNGLHFIDKSKQKLETVFKLYPWEFMVHEQDGKHLLNNTTNWIEPIWKMLWSNKAMLPILWKLFPSHPNLLPSFFGRPDDLHSFVKKPILSREGANVTIVENNTLIASTSGEYGAEGYIFQEFCKQTPYDGNYPVIGSWIVGGKSVGIGIRESTHLVTDNRSRFVPHFIID